MAKDQGSLTQHFQFEISCIVAQFKAETSKLNFSLAYLGPAQPQLVKPTIYIHFIA